MTLEELNQRYTDASWLIATRSASAAGKALIFSSESLDETLREIAVMYQLSDDDAAQLAPPSGSGTVAGIQKLAGNLLGEGQEAAHPAVNIARSAIRSGQARNVLTTFFKAGPSAAQAVATAGNAAAKGTPLGWIATAGYAVGSAAWFAYSARAYNLHAFEFIRQREGLVMETDPPIERRGEDFDVPGDRASASPKFAAIASRASALTSKAGGAVSSVLGKLRGSRS